MLRLFIQRGVRVPTTRLAPQLRRSMCGPGAESVDMFGSRDKQKEEASGTAKLNANQNLRVNGYDRFVSLSACNAMPESTDDHLDSGTISASWMTVFLA